MLIVPVYILILPLLRSFPCFPSSLPPHNTLILNRRSRVFLKLDNLQPSVSFKSRGIGNFILRSLARRSSFPNTHFYAASGGNAGIACVHAAKSYGFPATVVVPFSAKPRMIAALWAMGAAAVIQHGTNIAESQTYIENVLLPADPDGVFVPPFDHPDVWDGNATVMQEILEQLDGDPDVVICSVGGGGLLNGIMQALDEAHLDDKVQVIAMETDGADSLNQALRAGELITLPSITSAAKSLGCVRVSQKTFEYAQRSNVSSVVLSDAEAANGCCILAEQEGLMVELTVGVNVPICFDGRLQKILGTRKMLDSSSKVVIIVCGGNDISVEMLTGWRAAMMEAESVREPVIEMVAQSTPVAA